MRAFILASIVCAASAVAACGGSVDSEAEQTATDATNTADTDTTVTDTSTSGSDSSVPPADGSTGTGSIKCGMETCNAATQECCVGFSGSKCVAIGGCGGGATFTCSDSTSCPSGQVCCAERTMGGGGGGASCKATCGGFVLCATDAECKSDQRCVSGLGGFKICRSSTAGDGGFGGWDGGGWDGGGWDGGFGGWDGAFGGG